MAKKVVERVFDLGQARGSGGPQMTDGTVRVTVRNTEARDFDSIGDLCRRVYPETPPWSPAQLASHLSVFPDGQFVAVVDPDDRVVGMNASLIVHWDDYDTLDTWEQFTADGMFTNHNPGRGHTLYAAEAIVDPALQGHGVGSSLYTARRALVERHRLRRIRGGGRLRDYHTYAARMAPEEYVVAVVHGDLVDHTLTFQLHEGFHVLAVVPHYLSDDPESLGYAAVIEWLNPQEVQWEHYADRPTRFLHRDVARAVHGVA
jgi:ribosomal protein S18 acetylase RimI-like enzyme